jgi:hypothetical protein
MISIHQLAKWEEVYSWSSKKRGSTLHFAITRMRMYLESLDLPIIEAALTKELILAVASSNGLEEEHLERQSDEKLDQPIIMLDCGDGTHIVADGSHRMLRRFLKGLFTAPTWSVPEHIWQRFIITGMPGDEEGWQRYLDKHNPDAGKFDMDPPDR